MQPVGQAAEFKFESKFEPMQVIWQSLQRLFEKTIEDFDCKINGRALWAVLLHSLGGEDWQAQTQNVSKSAAVTAGSDRLG